MVAKTCAFCYNHVIQQSLNGCLLADTIEPDSAEIARERKDIYENSSNI